MIYTYIYVTFVSAQYIIYTYIYVTFVINIFDKQAVESKLQYYNYNNNNYYYRLAACY